MVESRLLRYTVGRSRLSSFVSGPASVSGARRDDERIEARPLPVEPDGERCADRIRGCLPCPEVSYEADGAE
jgi:hypothetical protein